MVIDTNLLVHAINREDEHYPAASEWIETLRVQHARWFLTWPICYEFLRVTTHLNIFPHPQTLRTAWEFLEQLLASPSAGLLGATPHHADVLREIAAELPRLRGNIMHDLHTAVLMREHGIRDIYTRDMDFHRFKFLRVIDPLG